MDGTCINLKTSEESKQNTKNNYIKVNGALFKYEA